MIFRPILRRAPQRLTSNVQLSTFNGVTERAHGGAGYGDRHRIRTTGLLTRLTYPSAGRAVEAGCGTRISGQTRCPICRSGTFNVQRSTLNFQGTRIWGQTRCPICRSGTFNVQRSTLNFQWGDRKGAWWGGIWGQTRNLHDRTLDPPDLSKPRSDGPSHLQRPDMGTDTEFPDLGTDTMSGIPDMVTDTMPVIPIRNVQRETFNSQLSTG